MLFKGLYVSFFPVIIYTIFGTCPHLSIGRVRFLRVEDLVMLSFSGTFAVISLMTAQAIEGVVPPSTNSIDQELMSISSANISNPSMMSNKISAATTLALLVGLVQVNFNSD